MSESSEGNYYTPTYFLTDHLGSTRVIAAFTGDGIDILDRSDYYPYGLRCEYPEAQASDNRWQYNGKELQIAGLPAAVKYLDYGARIYDPRIVRLTTSDRFSEKYYSQSPYSYTVGNPVRYIDVNGDSINVAAIRDYDRLNGTSYLQTIMGDLSSQTGLSYSVTESGMLVYAKDDNGNAVVATDADGKQIGSATARDIMTGAIGHRETAFGRINTDAGSYQKGNDFFINPAEVDSNIAGAVGVDSRTMGYGMTFMHEVSHTKPGGNLKDTPNELGNPGPLETRLNQARGELNAQGGNYGQRMTYSQYRNYNGYYYMPFSRQGTIRIHSGITPNTGAKYIKVPR